MLLPAGEVVNTTQSVHVALKVAPVLVEYLPVPQSVHTALPLLVLYLPAAQEAQEPASGPVNPRSQVQLERAVLLASDVLDAGQAVHASVPVVVLYFPASHATHDVADRSGRY